MAEGARGVSPVFGLHDEFIEHACTRCENKGLQVKASCYCQNCVKLFCTTCRDNHDEFASDHVLMDAKSCKQHGKMGCNVCATLKHRKPEATLRDDLERLVFDIGSQLEKARKEAMEAKERAEKKQKEAEEAMKMADQFKKEAEEAKKKADKMKEDAEKLKNEAAELKILAKK